MLVNNEKSIRKILNQSENIIVYSDRTYTNSWRKTSIIDNKYVLKEFDYKNKRKNKVWDVEYNIIQHLKKTSILCPDNIAIVTNESNKRIKAKYLKSILQGSVSSTYTINIIKPISQAIHELHQHDVLVIDAKCDNFVKVKNNYYAFDFGMAKIARYNSLYFKIMRGWEFFRIRKEMGNQELFSQFLHSYMKVSNSSFYSIIPFIKIYDIKERFKQTRRQYKQSIRGLVRR
ncbi:BUD32 family EKC/KEOPS complex subunit [Vibrio nitrifigilis]|uniref:Uncharacterized protein n=1 Tax=Vibrio nitrifigilis TaxID=2789781 RepID=A0ABS0GFE4_9VIBR|nr:hypothetical protein [Vibrio nitrifigilis]MBF9001134.1 hypothetical protein [Vibrio nitrifigilis]